ncbi:MAG: hypothetical protein IT365_10820 [Candidatus Hydrogenedentes bacterium]|nr:hypothetical protein [Candidatus Hydrogenedentota bacterium]
MDRYNSIRESCFVAILLASFVTAFCGQAHADAQAPQGMVFLQHCDPRFREGLRRHGLLEGAGYRLHNTGYDVHRFSERWSGSPLIAEARDSGQLYYLDRLSGGMPYQSLDGITEIAESLKDDPRFLGYQVHEWGNSPIHDYERIHKNILDKGQPFDAEHFASLEGRVEAPYYSGGDYGFYKDVYAELSTLEDVEQYLERYFKKMVDMTSGQVMSVTGFGQLYHAAFRLGAKNVMPEIGNQVPLSALQIAFARGAAREYAKPFGVYYEPWGGSPMGCVCALPFSPWFPDHAQLAKVMDGYNVGREFGSSRSLQRRLLYFSWLSGAAFYAEEWGAENYFGNWEDYPLAKYGAIVKEFDAINRRFSRPEPIVPAAIVMPPDTFGVDIRYIAGSAEKLWRLAPPDDFHMQLRAFASRLYATQPTRSGSDAHNLTPSPWIGCFDVLSSDAPSDVVSKYRMLVQFNAEQATGNERAFVYDGAPACADACIARLKPLLTYHVDGQVGTAHARSDGRYLLGVFNNLGITKTAAGGEVADPAATQDVVVSGPCDGVETLIGGAHVVTTEPDKIRLKLPAGQLAVLTFPDPADARAGGR